ncbi:hypothetical protein BKA93DRAFT_752128 [Sparassis latifolia]
MALLAQQAALAIYDTNDADNRYTGCRSCHNPGRWHRAGVLYFHDLQKRHILEQMVPPRLSTFIEQSPAKSNLHAISRLPEDLLFDNSKYDESGCQSVWENCWGLRMWDIDSLICVGSGRRPAGGIEDLESIVGSRCSELPEKDMPLLTLVPGPDRFVIPRMPSASTSIYLVCQVERGQAARHLLWIVANLVEPGTSRAIKSGDHWRVASPKLNITPTGIVPDGSRLALGRSASELRLRPVTRAYHRCPQGVLLVYQTRHGIAGWDMHSRRIALWSWQARLGAATGPTSNILLNR